MPNSYHIHMIIYNVALLIYIVTSILSFLFLMSYMAIVTVISSDIYFPESIAIEDYLKFANVNNDMDYLLRIFIPTICIIILVKIFQRLSLTKPKGISPNKGRENKYQKYIDDIKVIVSKYTKKNYDIQVTHETALVGETITLSKKSFNDLIEEKKDNFLFLLNHELYHSKIFDNSIGYLYNISFQILKVIISIVYLFIIGSFIINFHYSNSNNVEYWFLKNLLVYIFVYFLFISIYKIISKTFVYIQYFKECLCDRYASLVLKRDSFNDENVFDSLLDKKKSNKHPEIKQRKLCVKGKILFGKNIVYLLIGIFILAYFPFQEIEIYRNIIVYISIIAVTILLSLNLYISNDKKVYKHSIIAIIIGGILLYIKSRLYYIWLYGSLTAVNDIEYGMNISLDNTLIHIFFITFISLTSLSIIRSIKHYE